MTGGRSKASGVEAGPRLRADRSVGGARGPPDSGNDGRTLEGERRRGGTTLARRQKRRRRRVVRLTASRTGGRSKASDVEAGPRWRAERSVGARAVRLRTGKGGLGWSKLEFEDPLAR